MNLEIKGIKKFYHLVIIDYHLLIQIYKLKYMFLKTIPFMKITKTNWTFVLLCVLTFGIATAKAEDIEFGKVDEKAQSNKKPNTTVLLKIAEAAYKDAQFELATDKYAICISEDNVVDSSILLKLADCYWQMRNYSKAMETYKLVAREQCNDLVKFRVAELYARNNNYKLAGEWLQNVNGYNVKMDAYKNKKTIAGMRKDSTSWKIGFSSINSDYREFSPFLRNNTLFFSTNKPLAEKKANGWDGNNFSYLLEISSLISQNTVSDKTAFKIADNSNSKDIKFPMDIYECGANTPNYRNYRNLIHDKVLKTDNVNKLGKIISINDVKKYNTSSMSIDKNDNVYFASNYDKTYKTGVNRICIRQGKYSNSNGITDTKILPFGDPNSYSVMHPAVNSDGTLLIFSSDKDNGNGGFDLYFAQRASADEPWGEMHLFGKNINTYGNEVFPTISNDGYLFFSSDGMAGLGGLDIYFLSIENAIKDIGWAEHISYPINSSADDFGWTQDETGRKGYFTSDRNSNNDNIYSFNYIGEKLKTEKKLVYGYVLDNVTAQPLNDATVFMYSKDEKEVNVAKTDVNGKYQFPVNKSGKISIKVAAKSYLSDCILVYIDNNDQVGSKNPPRNIVVSSAKVGEVIWKSTGINYDFNKSEIRSDAALVLNELTVFLKKNDVNIEVSSHTDSRGSNVYNLALSQKRAESVVDYLLKQGIDKSRIVAKGYGESQLINNCGDDANCTEAEHQANRRTEVRVTGYQSTKDNLKFDMYKLKDKDKVNINLFPKDFFEYCK